MYVQSALETTMLLAATSTVIDVRDITSRERESSIFAAFRALDVGDAVAIVSDNDPKALYFAFQTQAPGNFSWLYVQNGPDVWRVNIHKLARSYSAGECCGACGGGV